MPDARQTAMRLLRRLENQSAYSNIILDEGLARSPLSAQEKKFCAALFYGVLERRLTLDAVIESLLDRRGAKLSDDVREIIRLALYQLLYMNAVPESAAVDEAVKAAKKLRNPALGGFVNGLLRNFLRGEKKLPQGSTPVEALSLEYSCPAVLVEKWLAEYGTEKTENFLRASVGRAPTYIRVNTAKITTQALAERLRADEFSCGEVNGFPDALQVSFSGAVEQSAAFREGLFHVQDLSSQLCCAALGAKPGETVLDLCAAPGGKSFTIAEQMRSTGRLLAFDLHENRVRLIRKGVERLGLVCITAAAGDAKTYNPALGQADRVLCDAPCSGLGVIRRKPEIKYKNPADYALLPDVQYKILDNAARYVKPGGTLLYSTCTLSRDENNAVAERFLREHTEFRAGVLTGCTALSGAEIIGGFQATILPELFDGDGFFLALFVRGE